MLYRAIRDRRSEVGDPLNDRSRVWFVQSLPSGFADATQVGVIAADQLDEERLLGFEVMIQAARQDPGGVGNFLQRGAQARGGDDRSRGSKDLGSASSVRGSGTGRERARLLPSGSPLRCHANALRLAQSQPRSDRNYPQMATDGH